MSPQKITVLYFEGCPNHRPAVEMIRKVLAQRRIQAQLEEVEVNVDDVESRRFLGSPTIHVDGVDIEPDAKARTDYAMSCRVYGTDNGLSPEEMLLASLGIED